MPPDWWSGDCVLENLVTEFGPQTVWESAEAMFGFPPSLGLDVLQVTKFRKALRKA